MTFTPEKYREASVLSREAGEELIARLEWMTLQPRVIVDLGCGTGELSARLQERYKDAQIIAMDLSDEMINYARQNHTTFSCVCANASALPFANHSVDLLFANLLLPWTQDFSHILRECHRVLCPEGVLIFTALGPDTFREWQSVFEANVIPSLFDMHDAGDLLLKNNFSDPVLDVSYYTLTYQDQIKLFQELKMSGMLNDLAVQDTNNILPDDEGRFAVTYEVIFAHAFAAELKSITEEGITRIPLDTLRRQLRS